MSSLYLQVQLDMLDRLGFARARAREVLGVTDAQLGNPRVRLPLSDVAALYDTASTALSHANLGLEVGYAFRVAGFAKSGRIYAYCRDLVEVVETNARYQRIAVDAGEIAFVEEDGRAFLDFAPHYRDAERYRHITELIFGSYGTAFQWLSWGSGKGNKAVYLRHSAPADGSLHARVFKCPVHFGQADNRLEYHAETVRDPLPTADPERLAITRERLDRIFAQRGAAQSGVAQSGVAGGHADALREACEAAIRLCLREGHPSLDGVARATGRTERRLRTDLKASGLKFRELVDEARKALFHEGRANGLSLSEIARSLAYNDQAAFNRAFRRWYGCAPGAYLAGLETGAGAGVATPVGADAP